MADQRSKTWPRVFEKMESDDVSIAGRDIDQEEEYIRRRQLECSMSSIDQLQDFETYDDEDLIYREYEPVMIPDSSHYERFDRLGEYTWKTGRPNHWYSFLYCSKCVLETTFLSGCMIGLILTVVVYLDINLSDLCNGSNFASVEIPEYLAKIRTVSDMVSSVIVQFWHLITLLLIFNWSLIKDCNIIPWNLLGGLLTGMYKLLYGMFYGKDAFWRSFPAYGIFIFIAAFNSLRVAWVLKETLMLGHAPLLVLRLMAQFVVGLPVALIFMLWINPAYTSMDEISKVVFASFIPLLIVIPKILVRKSAESMGKVNHPGTSVFLLTAMYTSISLLYRALQVQIGEIIGYSILSIVLGIHNTLERATVPYLDFLLHKVFKGKVRSMTEFMTPRRSRLMSDLTLINMITEPAMVFTSCTAMAMIQYLFNLDHNGNMYDLNFLCRIASKRIAIALIIEMCFNILSLKVESYYFNMAVMKVWKKKKFWIIFTLILHAAISIMCFSHVAYNIMDANNFVNGTLICSSPFRRSTIKMNTSK